MYGMKQIRPEALRAMKETYAPGTRVKLNHMNDPFVDLPAGTTGTVTCVDDIGTIHVRWDNGSTLGVAYGEDSCSRI